MRRALAFVVAAVLAIAASAEEDRVERSIRRGLEFIARGQIETGTFDSGPAKGFAGIPALCGMAFLAAGDTPLSEPNGPVILRIVDHLLDKARDDGYLGVGGGSKSNATGTAKNGTGYYKVDADGSNLNMRSSDRASASILGKVPDNTRVYVSDISNGMGKIVYNGLTGWVQLSWITKA